MKTVKFQNRLNPIHEHLSARGLEVSALYRDALGVTAQFMYVTAIVKTEHPLYLVEVVARHALASTGWTVAGHPGHRPGVVVLHLIGQLEDARYLSSPVKLVAPGV